MAGLDSDFVESVTSEMRPGTTAIIVEADEKSTRPVDDIVAMVTELRSHGVVFEQVNVPGLTTVDDIAEVAGNYPSRGSGEKAAWFRDSEGNMLGIGQPTP